MATSLIPLPAVERLSPAVIRILGGNPGKFTLQGTNTYLLGTGRRRILIDTGEGKPAWLADIKSTLEKENAVLESALITHWHRDHVGGIADIQTTWPGTSIYKNDPTSELLDIQDGQVFRAEGVTLTASHTPGHTKDHMVFVLSEEDAIFTADNVLGQGTAVFEDLSAYMSSLNRMRTMFKGRAYPGHGPVIADGPGKILEYIEHRQQREDQVLATLGAGKDRSRCLTPMEIVRAIYTDIPESLYEAARGGVVQVLMKLEKEGKVLQVDGGRWTLAEGSVSPPPSTL